MKGRSWSLAQRSLPEEEPGRPADLKESEYRRAVRLLTQFYGALRAFDGSEATLENAPSLATCEHSPTSGGDAARDAETLNLDLSVPEQNAIDAALRLGIDDIDRAAEMVQTLDARTALYTALDRGSNRQEKVLELLDRGMPGKAKRLAQCKRQSVQLECPDTFGAGGCGSDDNYVPASCGLRICSDCATDRKAEKVERYKPVIHDMKHPTFLTLTIENVDDFERGVDFITDSFGKLRRRTIPPSGETVRENDDGELIRKRWVWSQTDVDVSSVDRSSTDVEFWKPRLLEQKGGREQAKYLQERYVNKIWSDVTGTHEGKNIPFGELVRGGLYAVDIKAEQAPDGDGYNVHLHAAVDMVYVPQAALSAEWEDITGSCVVDVRRIYDRSESGVEDALMETVGYALKEPEFESVEDEVDFLEAMEDRQMVHPFGELHGNVPEQVTFLVCSTCECIPAYWNYAGMVDEHYDNMGVVHGLSDHPPPGSGSVVPEDAMASSSAEEGQS